VREENERNLRWMRDEWASKFEEVCRRGIVKEADKIRMMEEQSRNMEERHRRQREEEERLIREYEACVQEVRRQWS